MAKYILTPNEYQKNAMRTNDGNSAERLLEFIKNNPHIDVGGIINAIQGLSGESGELIDMIKKTIFHKHPLDELSIKKEAGDCCWYIAMLCESFGWNLEEIMQMNIDKLKARYPEGFEVERSIHREHEQISDQDVYDQSMWC